MRTPRRTKSLRSVDIATREPAEALRERTDSCVVPAAGVVGEAMVAFVIADAYREKFGGDHIDLYQVHRPEDDTDVEDTLSALTDLVRAGKVRYIGSSTFPASRIVEAQWGARGGRGGAGGGAGARLRALQVRAAAVLDPRARDRERRAAHRAAPRHGRHPLEPARRRLAVRPLPQGRG